MRADWQARWGKIVVRRKSKLCKWERRSDKEEIMAGSFVKWWRHFKQYKQFSGKKSQILSLSHFCFSCNCGPEKNSRKKSSKRNFGNHKKPFLGNVEECLMQGCWRGSRSFHRIARGGQIAQDRLENPLKNSIFLKPRPSWGPRLRPSRPTFLRVSWGKILGMDLDNGLGWSQGLWSWACLPSSACS